MENFGTPLITTKSTVASVSSLDFGKTTKPSAKESVYSLIYLAKLIADIEQRPFDVFRLR
jgi:hypothetical protein